MFYKNVNDEIALENKLLRKLQKIKKEGRQKAMEEAIGIDINDEIKFTKKRIQLLKKNK